MAEHHGAPEVGQLPKAWTRGRRRTENRQRVSDAKIRTWTMQNEMRGVLGRVSTGAEGRVLNSAKKDKSLTEGCVRLLQRRRE